MQHVYTYTHIPIYLISKPYASPGSHCLVQDFVFREDYQIAKNCQITKLPNCLVSRRLSNKIDIFKVWERSSLRQGLPSWTGRTNGKMWNNKCKRGDSANICKHLQPMRIFRVRSYQDSDRAQFVPHCNVESTLWTILQCGEYCWTVLHIFTHTQRYPTEEYTTQGRTNEKGQELPIVDCCSRGPPKTPVG